MKITKNELAKDLYTYKRENIMPVKFIPFTMQGGNSYSVDEPSEDGSP